MENLAGKEVVVVGAGRSGILSARLLRGEGAGVLLLDDRSREAVERSLGEPVPEGVAFRAGMMSEEDVPGKALVVVSPGVPGSKLPLAALAAAGVPGRGELELGFRRFRGKVAAITGTNGKSTVTTLVGGMAARSFARVFVGGNLGTPFVAAAGGPYDWGVVEVSSFQLEAIAEFRPAVAALLNLTEDHRDRYPDFASYAEAKMAIFRNMGPADAAVVNADDPQVVSRSAPIRARKVRSRSAASFRKARSFRGTTWSTGRPRGRSGTRGGRCGSAASRTSRTRWRRSASRGRWGFRAGTCWRSSRSSRGSPTRGVRADHPGVSYFNDSKGTNVGAVLAALEGFPEPVVLVAGGKDKGVDFRPLREPLSRKARAVVLLGEARGRMERELAGAAPIVTADTFEGAIRAAADAARPGDVVVFSPACSSYDMFRNFEERGEAFRRAVKELPE
jgi:UDP-N-acetylmuramoylalanine--D-glutamate ligase